jgi:acetyltransferase
MVRERFASVFCDSVRSAKKCALAVLNLVGEETEQIFRTNDIPCFDGSVDACLSALKSFIEYGRFRARQDNELRTELPPPQIGARAKSLAAASRPPGILQEEESRQLLREYDFQFPDYRIASTWSEVKAAARVIGYPVILKGAISFIAHRSAAGLVSRPAHDVSDLQREFDSLENRIGTLTANQAEKKILLEKYLPHECEMILGIKRDPTFGPVVLFGLGGIFAEALKDFSIRLAPVTTTQASEMIREIRALPVLQKFLSDTGVSWDVIVDTILKAARLAIDLHGPISAIDLNPLAVVPGSSRPILLDAKVHLENETRI